VGTSGQTTKDIDNMHDVGFDTVVSGGSTILNTSSRIIFQSSKEMPSRRGDKKTTDSGVPRGSIHHSWYGCPDPERYLQLEDQKRHYLQPCDALLSEDLCRSLGWFPPEEVRFQKCVGSRSPGHPRLYISDLSQADERNFLQVIADLRAGKNESTVDIESSILTLAGQPPSELTLNASLVRRYLASQRSNLHDSDSEKILKLMDIEVGSVEEIRVPLESLSFLQETYSKLGGATISAAVIENRLTLAKWTKPSFRLSTTANIFSCIAMMETGKVNIGLDDFEGVFALSYGNSIFIKSYLLGDTDVYQSGNGVTRIVGNIGRPGLSFLVPPAAEPLIRPLSLDYRAVNYEPFDGKNEDNFNGTSLHLILTSHKFPLEYGETGIFDHQVFLVESVISVHDAGQWVADIRVPIRPGLDMEGHSRVIDRDSFLLASCEHGNDDKQDALGYFSTADTWEEVLDSPPSVAVIRAQKNWPARLALFAILNRYHKYDTQTKPLESEGSLEEWEAEGSESTSEASEGESSDDSGESSRRIKKQAYLLRSDVVVCWACVKLSLDTWIMQAPHDSIYIIA
jgi:hypothetical protein